MTLETQKNIDNEMLLKTGEVTNFSNSTLIFF